MIMSVSVKSFLTFLLISMLYSGFVQELGATHISKPVFEKSKTEYTVGENVILRGWVNYQGQPTPDVLLNAKVLRPDGSEIIDEFFMSDERGNFKFEFETMNLLPGAYQIIITSQCLEVHRQVCTYQSETLTIQLRE